MIAAATGRYDDYRLDELPRALQRNSLDYYYLSIYPSLAEMRAFAPGDEPAYPATIANAYIHVPFCSGVCDFCSYYLVAVNPRRRAAIGRYLEHSRIFYFANNGAPLFYIGSADWMRRNLSSRVEAAVSIDDPRLQEYVWLILQNSLNDSRQAWEMLPDGRYRQRLPSVGSNALEAGGVQNYLMQHTRMTSTLAG